MLWEFVLELAVRQKETRSYRRSSCNCIRDDTYIHSCHSGPKNWSDDYALPLIALISTGERLIILHAGGCSGFFFPVIISDATTKH